LSDGQTHACAMKNTWILLTWLLSFGYAGFGYPSYKIQKKKDTVYYLTFLDVIEKDFSKGSKLNTSPWLDQEREVIDKIILRKMKNEFVMLPFPIDCLRSYGLDSIFRRNQNVIEAAYVQCKLVQPLVIIDATWTYLSDGSFRGLQLQHPNNPRSYSYWIIGTWWKVRSILFLPRKGVINSRDSDYSQWSNVKPMKSFPGINHKRFFKRPVRKLKFFLRDSLGYYRK
jgi:hypothetical protein